MGRKKMAVEGGFHLDLTGLGGLVEDTRVSVSDILHHGIDHEVREEAGLIAALLQSGNKPLPEPYRLFMVDALHKIAHGMDANKAFGLGRSGLSPHAVKGYVHLANQLRGQGMNTADAWAILARLTPNLSALGPDNGRGPALKKQVERAHKSIFGVLPRQK